MKIISLPMIIPLNMSLHIYTLYVFIIQAILDGSLPDGQGSMAAMAAELDAKVQPGQVVSCRYKPLMMTPILTFCQSSVAAQRLGRPGS